MMCKSESNVNTNFEPQEYWITPRCCDGHKSKNVLCVKCCEGSTVFRCACGYFVPSTCVYLKLCLYMSTHFQLCGSPLCIECNNDHGSCKLHRLPKPLAP